MDRIDILHKISEEHGSDVFHAREGKLRKALEASELTPKDAAAVLEVCTFDRKLTKIILRNPDISATEEEQARLEARFGRPITALRDVHTAVHNNDREVSETGGELDDGRFVYSVVPARKQCLHLVRTLSPAGYTVTVPDTVVIGKKDYKIVSIADGCFEGNTAIESVVLPSTLETIGKNVFCNCSSLKKCELPRHLKSVGDNAFAFTALEEVVFQDYLESVGAMAFYRCRSLVRVSISKRTSQLGVGAFAGCSALTDMKVSDKNGRFMCENRVLYSRKQDRIVQVLATFEGKLSPPRSLLTVEQYAADGCAGITELDFPVSVTSIGPCAFRNCTGIAKVKLPNTLNRIGEKAFEGCTSIRKLDVPASVKTLGKMAFAGCTGIEIAEVKGVMKYSGLKVFDGCTGMNRITIDKASEYTASDFPKNVRIKFTHG